MSKRDYEMVRDGKTKKIKHNAEPKSKVNLERSPITPFPMKSRRKRGATPSLVASFDVEYGEDMKTTSDILILNSESNEITFNPELSDVSEEWQELGDQDLENNQIARILSEVFPNFPDTYVLTKHLRTFGYDVRDDGSVVVIDGELIEDFEPSEADFIFVPTDKSDNISNILTGLDEELQKLPFYDRRALDEDGNRIHNSYGRSMVFAVIGDQGKIYPLRINTVILRGDKKIGKPTLSLHRIRVNDKTRNLRREYHRQNISPRTSRNRLGDGNE